MQCDFANRKLQILELKVEESQEAVLNTNTLQVANVPWGHVRFYVLLNCINIGFNLY